MEYVHLMGGVGRNIITTLSRAQGTTISNDKFKSHTAHTAKPNRVASPITTDMALIMKHEDTELRWQPNILIVAYEAGLCSCDGP